MRATNSNYVEHDRVTLDFEGAGRTKQSFREECDANKIMARWQKTGLVEHINKAQPRYGDFSNPTDYLEALTKVREAQTEFAQLSSAVRDRMGNEPAELLRFLADEGNRDEAVELGLIPKAASTAEPEPEPEPEPAPTPPGGEATPISGGD